MPARVGDYDRTTRDQDVTLPGEGTPIFHAAYTAHGNSLQTADVFAIPAARPAAEQDAFGGAVGLSARLQKQAALPLPFATARWRYLLLGPAAPDLRAALAAEFRGG